MFEEVISRRKIRSPLLNELIVHNIKITDNTLISIKKSLFTIHKCCLILLQNKSLTKKNLKLISLLFFKRNKSCCYVVRWIYDNIPTPFVYIPQQTLSKGVFPEAPEISKITSMLKKRDKAYLTNYGLFSVLPHFSKILAKFM